MDIANKKLWQQAAGDTDRNYAEFFIKFDVIFAGPGDAGPWGKDCKERLLKDELSPKKLTDLKRLCEDMQDGDIVVLRIGTSTVLAVGQIIGAYEWHEEFGDVDGWDLQHTRRVRWLWHNLSFPKNFKTYDLKFGVTTDRLSNSAVIEWLSSLDIPEKEYNRPLAILPVKNLQNQISIDQISEFLFDHGVASISISNLVSEISELIRIGKWYRSRNRPSEHETVAYLVVPLLRALGWTPQRMAIEWNQVDVALFDKLPRSNNSLKIVVEAKKMDNSCLTAISQAKDYAKRNSGCNRLIVTDGLRYGVFCKENDDFKLYAYMNLSDLRGTYPIYECKGCKDALLSMTPEWSPESKAVQLTHIH